MTLEERIKDASQHVRPAWSDARAERVGQQLTRAVAAKAATKAMLLKLLSLGVVASLGGLALLAVSTPWTERPPVSSHTTSGEVAPTSITPPAVPSPSPASSSSSSGATSLPPGLATSPPGEPAIDSPDSFARPAQLAPPASSVLHPGAAPSPRTVQNPSESSWRTLAEQGRFDEAYTALRANGGAVRDEVGDLLLAADVARLSKHPGEAAGYLRTILQKFRSDPRAALAAFTLGRVLLDQLGQAREAASVFAQARTLSPSGALAEDALAREVEAWSRAGDNANARATARAYLSQFPAGRRASSVRQFGGID